MYMGGSVVRGTVIIGERVRKQKKVEKCCFRSLYVENIRSFFPVLGAASKNAFHKKKPLLIFFLPLRTEKAISK